MHLPPAAAWKVDSARWQRRMLCALGLAGALVSAFFCLNQRWGVSTVVLLAALAACSALATAGLWWPMQGHLRWDGEHWHWSDEEDRVVTHLSCVVDLQRFMLLRIACAQAPSLWLWLESPAMDARWLALRRAIVASPQAMTRVWPGSLPR